MYYQPEAMLEQYDIEIKQITKGRGVFCCETESGEKSTCTVSGICRTRKICAAKYYAACRKRDIRGTGQSDKRRAVCGNG